MVKLMTFSWCTRCHVNTHVRLPIPRRIKQQLVWSDDVGAVAALAFADGPGTAHSPNWYGVKLDVVGDELSGDEIAMAFSNARLDPHGCGETARARRLRYVKDLPPCGRCVSIRISCAAAP